MTPTNSVSWDAWHKEMTRWVSNETLCLIAYDPEANRIQNAQQIEQLVKRKYPSAWNLKVGDYVGGQFATDQSALRALGYDDDRIANELETRYSASPYYSYFGPRLQAFRAFTQRQSESRARTVWNIDETHRLESANQRREDEEREQKEAERHQQEIDNARRKADIRRLLRDG